MRRRPIFVAAIAAFAGLALIGPGISHARTTPDTQDFRTPAQLAAITADKAAGSGFDALAKGPNESFVRRDIVGGSGGLQYVSYERTYQGLPVVGGDAVVVTDSSGTIKNTVSALGKPLAVKSVTPQVKAAAATKTARAQLDRVTSASSPSLVVFAEKNALAWEVVLIGQKNGTPSRLHVYVDAVTGKVLQTRDDVRFEAARGYYNGNIDITTNAGLLDDPTRPGVKCGNNGTKQTYRNGGTGTGTDLQTACVDAYYAAQQEWDMLKNWLNRNGINGSGRGFPMYVGLNQVNALWDGSSATFGHSQDNQRQATPLDVVAHELGHAIFQTTPGGAGSGNENGGINESTGDIFGALTEFYANNPNDPGDYLVGEEVNLVGNGPIRNMTNPSAVGGHPNCYSSSIPNTEVHAAAGPGNHAFALISLGSVGSPTCNSSTVNGIGIQKAGQIYMGALNMKTSSWRYANVRAASVQTAINLFGASSAECATTKAAWSAVSVAAAGGEPACTTGPGNDFSIAVNPTSGTVARGATVTTTVNTTTTTGTAQNVNLTASGLPTGVTASFSPSSVTSGGSSTLTLTASASAALGTKAITVTGTGTSATHTATYSVTVTGTPGGDDFSISVSPTSAEAKQNSSTEAKISTATTSGNPQTVNLSVSGMPAGVTATIDPTSITSGDNATLTVDVAQTTTPGTYPLTITGTGTATHTATFTLTVTGDTPPGGCNGIPAWSASQSYVPGDVVSHNGHKWNSTWWSTGAEPGAPQSWAVWSDAGAC